MKSQIISLLNDYRDHNLDIDSDYVFNTYKVPRVTKIISKCIHNDSLMYWANGLGFKHTSYSKTMDKACDIGSETHENIDKYMCDRSYIPADFCNGEAYYAYNSFLKWFNDINNIADVEVIYHEKQMICPYFGGTIDGLYRVNGKIYLVDYKTSNHITYNYCLQLAAYRYMLKTVLNINIDGCIILQLNKENISYNEYVLNFDNPNHLGFILLCEDTFLALTYAYYNILTVESIYKKLDWKRE